MCISWRFCTVFILDGSLNSGAAVHVSKEKLHSEQNSCSFNQWSCSDRLFLVMGSLEGLCLPLWLETIEPDQSLWDWESCQ